MDDTKAILWLAIEDYSGLWEAVWQLRSTDPNAGAEVLMDRARASVFDLVARALVRLYRCQEPYGDMSPVNHDEVGEVLAAVENWLEPEPDSVSIRFSATPAGEEAYASWPG